MYISTGKMKQLVGFSYGRCVVSENERTYDVGFGNCLNCKRLYPVYTTCRAKDFICEACLKVNPYLTKRKILSF